MQNEAVERMKISKRQWYYRGSLKSCNYTCSYCPFSKKKGVAAALEQDRKQFFRFVEWFEQTAIHTGAVQIVPYGEALIHPYYWEGMARLSRIASIQAVGAQSNFSFPVEKMLKHFINHGGEIEKLRLWGTFHPEMTSVDAFAKQCEKLSEWKVLYCAGVVGVPEQIPVIKRLRKQLSDSVYLWVNKMDGLGRNYTTTEVEEFLAIDEYFDLELRHHRAEQASCGNQVFVEADGAMRRCNICRASGRNLYEVAAQRENNEVIKVQARRVDNDLVQEPVQEKDIELAEQAFAAISCNRRECSCYLAYNNNAMPELLFFQPYPAFRIPKYPKAVFLDIDGTLIPKGESVLPKERIRRLKALAAHSDIYLATSLPLEDAMHKVKPVWDSIAGGVFASGARYIANGKDWIAPIKADWLEQIRIKQDRYHFRVYTYQKSGQTYKVTLTFSKHRFQKPAEAEAFARQLAEELAIPQECRWFLEQNCIQVVQKDRDKLAGILEIMQEMGYSKEEVMVAGDAAEDAEMLRYFPWSVKVGK